MRKLGKNFGELGWMVGLGRGRGHGDFRRARLLRSVDNAWEVDQVKQALFDKGKFQIKFNFSPMFPPSFSMGKLLLFAGTRLGALLLSLVILESPARAGDAYKWTVQYLVDNSRMVFGHSQKSLPRHNTGLALSPDGKYLYASYSHSFNRSGEVRRIQIDVADFERATIGLLAGVVAQGVATDDQGRVYISDLNAIQVYDAALETRLLRIPAGQPVGVGATREGGQLVLYSSDAEDGTISRWVLKEKGEGLASATLEGFGGSGVFKVPGVADLRGLKIDSKGHIWVADVRANKIFRMTADGKDLKVAEVKEPMDMAIDGDRVLVTRRTERAITVLNYEMNLLGNLGVPWEDLELSPLGNNRQGILSGIVAVAGKGFFVANECGQTANQKSTYGRIDKDSDMIGNKLFRDVKNDDNEPILRATEVTLVVE